MTSWRYHGQQAGLSQDGATLEAPLQGYNATGTTAPRPPFEMKVYAAYTFENLFSNANFLDVGLDFALLDDGITLTSLVTSHSATGDLEDLTGSETPAADSLMAVEYDNTGMHGDSANSAGHAVTITQASITTSPFAVGGANISLYTTGTSRRWLAADERFGNEETTRARAVFKQMRSQDMFNLRVYTTAQQEALDVNVDRDGTESTAVFVTVVATGEIEDITGVESFAVGEDFSFTLAPHSSSLNNYSYIQVDGDAAERQKSFGIISGTVGGQTVIRRTERIGTVDISNLAANITAFSSPDDPTLDILISGVPSSNLTLVPVATGYIEDITGSDAIADDDEIGVAANAGTTGSFGVLPVYVEMPGEAFVAAGSDSMRPGGNQRAAVRRAMRRAA